MLQSRTIIFSSLRLPSPTEYIRRLSTYLLLILVLAEDTSKMENTGNIKQEELSLSPGIFDIPGEPAVVINGVPDEPQTDCIVAKDEPITSSGSTVGSGEWLEGREVRKFFLGHYYSGRVIKFDKQCGWYRVGYEDGDSEDLDWSELEEVLLPLDVTVPLRSISLQLIKNRQRRPRTYGHTPQL